MFIAISSGAGVLPVGTTWNAKRPDGIQCRFQVGIPRLIMLAAKKVFEDSKEKVNIPLQILKSLGEEAKKRYFKLDAVHALLLPSDCLGKLIEINECYEHLTQISNHVFKTAIGDFHYQGYAYKKVMGNQRVIFLSTEENFENKI